jgi:hypothetical protein
MSPFLFEIFPSDEVATEKNKERSVLNTHAESATPELKSCEHRLRCVVEGIEKDQLLVRFSHIDKSDLDREFSFVLDVSTRSYRGESRRVLFIRCFSLLASSKC